MQKYENIFEEIKSKASLEDEVEKAGSRLYRAGTGKLKCCCPLHNEKTPSFMIYKGEDYDTYFCWGCIEENEPILTNRGFVPIKDISVGDIVLGVDGYFSRVIEKSFKGMKDLFEVKLGSSKIPLKLTDDHICFFVKEKDMISNTPYIRKEKYDSRVKFSSRLKKAKRSSIYLNKLSIRKDNFNEVSVGDYFIYPVIKDRIDINFDCNNIIKKYTKGPNVKRITNILVDKDMAWLMGMYIAEGSYNGRSITFSLSISEIDKCEKIMNILEKSHGLKSTLKVREEKNIAEVICSKKDLSDIFPSLFGSGAENKKIPFDFFKAPIEIQKSLIDGYLSGDGNKYKTNCITVSENLAYSIFSISIQCGMNPHISERSEYVDNNGIYHKKTYLITFRKRESLKGFYEEISGVSYFFSKITEIKNCKKSRTYDLGVEGSSSFTTKNCVVHNCKSGGDVIEFIKELHGFSNKQAVDYFSKNYKIEFSENEKSIEEIFSNNIEKKNKKNKAIYNYGISTSRFVKDLLKKSENLDNDYKRIIPYLKAMDFSLFNNNIETFKFHREMLLDYIDKDEEIKNDN